MKNIVKARYMEILLISGMIIAVLSGIYAVLTLGQAIIHTDCSTGDLYYRSVYTSGKLIPDTWNFNNAEIGVFSTIALSSIMHALISNTILARVIASALVLVFVCCCDYWFSKKILVNNSYYVALPILFVVINGSVYKDMVLFQAAYTLVMVAMLLCFGLVYNIFFENTYKFWHIVILSCLLCILMLHGLRYVAEILLPILGMIAFDRLIALKNNEKVEVKKDIISVVIYIFAPIFVGIVWYRYILYSNLSHMNITSTSQIKIDVSVILDNLRQTVFNLFSLFGYTEESNIVIKAYAIILSIGIFVVLPILQLKVYKNLNRAEKAFTIFGWMHNIVLVAAIILTSKLYERYLISSVFIAVLISANYISNKLSLKKHVSYAIGTLFILLTIISSLNLILSTTGWKNMVKEQKDECQILLDKGITKVYASYWLAYPHEIYSNNKLTAAAVSITPRGLQKYYRLVDDNSFEKAKGRSCVILRKDEAELYPNAVYNSCGQQDEDFVIKDVYVCDNGNYWKTDLIVYVYNEDVGDRLSDGFKDGVIDVKEMEFNWYGTMTSDYILLEENGLIHGPISYLKEGHYSMRIEGENLAGCNCAVVSETAQDNVESVVKDITDEYIDIEVELKSGIEDLQVYLSNPIPDKKVKFYDILVQ